MTATHTASALKPRHKRIILALVVLAAVAAIVTLVLNAFQSNLVFFFSPSQIVAKEAPVGKTFRLGGMVEEGSIKREGTKVNFVVTDTVQKVPVQFVGILPDLFKEGKGVVAQGKWGEGVFTASEVLAKHDENYMPPEAAEALKQARQGGKLAPSSTAANATSNTTAKPTTKQ
jgi:cytochrome c-type biogenesis protein CcmE